MYISGRISNNRSCCSQFEEAEKQWQKYGYEVINPCKLKRHKSWVKNITRDIRILEKCNGIYMLAGWEKSSGATIENMVAKKLNKKILYEDLHS